MSTQVPGDRARHQRGRGAGAMIAAALLLVACSSSREVGPIERPGVPTSSSAGGTSSTPIGPTTTSGATTTTTVPGGSLASSTTTTAAASTTTTTLATQAITGVAVAGTAGQVENRRPPFTETNPFSEAVRLPNGSCIGWQGSRGGSTAGLAAGAPIVVLAAEANEEIGRGTIQASHWEDMSRGGQQWNCLFDFEATISGAPAEFRIKVANLEPWLARPDPTNPDTWVASVSSDANIGLIRSCPAVPEESEDSNRRPTTTRPRRLVSGWDAVGQYWSRGVDALCQAGLPVTAIARPCRPPGFGSEYIVAVVNSNDSDIVYDNGAEVRRGTPMTVVVATGRLCG